MLEKELIERLHEAGRRACENYASKINAGNAHEYAATSLADFIGRERINGESGVIYAMRRGKVDLSMLLGLDEGDFDAGCAAFAGGCYAWLEQNPD